MSNPEEFRRYAQRCTEIAQHVPADEAEALSAMAQTWVKLADDEQRIADLVSDADRGFANTPLPDLGDPVRRLAFWDCDRGFH